MAKGQLTKQFLDHLRAGFPPGQRLLNRRAHTLNERIEIQLLLAATAASKTATVGAKSIGSSAVAVAVNGFARANSAEAGPEQTAQRPHRLEKL